MRTKTILIALTLVAGCDWFQPTPRPKVSDDLQRRLDQIAEYRADIDLAITKADSELIGSAQANYDRLTKAWKDSNVAKTYEYSKTLEPATQKAEAEMDKAIETAARHRCGR